jgi:hypothetical protein
MEGRSQRSRVESVCRTRKVAAATLAGILTYDLTGQTESGIRDRWLKALQDVPHLMREGWYQPPPKGLSILIGVPPRYERIRYRSLRDEMTWPRTDVCPTADSLLFAYASPVNMSTSMIGDLAISLYGGNDQSLREHLSNAFEVTARVTEFAAVGMEFRELYAYGARLINETGQANSYFSLVSHTGLPDVGHTAPWSFGDYPREAARAIESGDPSLTARTIAEARLFISNTELTRIEATMAFSVETRVAHLRLPVACFHVWVIFINGRKTICSGFGPLLELFRMDEYLTTEAMQVLLGAL